MNKFKVIEASDGNEGEYWVVHVDQIQDRDGCPGIEARCTSYAEAEAECNRLNASS